MKKKSCKKMPFGGLLQPAMNLVGGLINDYNYVENYKPEQTTPQATLFNFNNTNTPLMPMGGMIPYGNETVELENGEPFMYPSGGMGMISESAPTHAQGGVPINLPNGTRVLGKDKAWNGKMFKQEGAKLKRQNDKYKKILEDRPTRLTKRSANLMLDKINKKFNRLFQEQEASKQMSNNYQMPNGGTVTPGKNAANQVLEQYRPSAVKTQEYGDFGKADYGDLLKSTPLYSPDNRKNVIATENYYKGVPGPQYIVSGDTEGARMDTYEVNGKKRFAGSEMPNKQPRFVERMYEQNAPFVKNQDGTVSTHRMAYAGVDDKFIAYPTLVQQGDSLVTPVDPIGYALANQNYISFDTEAEAEKYAAGSWKENLPNREYASGGEIHIKPSKRGTFTAAAKKRGKGVQSFASQVLANKDSYSSAMVKKANFARNASKWRKGPNGLEAQGDVYGTYGYDYFSQSPQSLLEFQRYAGLSTDNVYGPKTNEAFNVLGNEWLGNYNIQPINAIASTNSSTGNLLNNFNYNPLSTYTNIGTDSIDQPDQGNNTNGLENLGKLKNIGGTLAPLAPMAYNVMQGLSQPDLVDKNAYINPYANQAMSLMKDRRYNISPELEANRLAQGTYYRNLREAAPSQAQLLGNLQSGQISTQRANAAAYARKQNMDNQYRAEQAQFMAGIGAQDIARQQYIENINAQTEANRRKVLGTGLSDLSNFSQNQRMMSNQKKKDDMLRKLLENYAPNYTYTDTNGWTFNK